MTTAVAPAPDAPPAVTVTASGRWRGVLGLMDAWSADARMLEAPPDGAAVRSRPLPLPLLMQPELAPGHDGGKLGLAVIDRIWTEQGFVMGEGRFDMEDPAGVDLARKVGQGLIRFVSLDVDDATAHQVCLAPDGEINQDCDPNDPATEMGMVYSGWRVMGATLLAHPAFPDAHIALADDTTEQAAQSAQAAVQLADTPAPVPAEDGAEIVGYDPAWGCVVPNADGTAWEQAACDAEGAVEANPTGDGPYDPEQVAAAATTPVPEEAVQDEGTGCVAPDPANDGAWLPADCTAEGAVPANDTGDAPAEEVTDAANLADQELSVRLAARLATLAAGDPTHAGVAIKALDTGRVLLLQRALDDSDPASGMWEFPGGSIEPGEDPQAAAWREFQEETGVALPDNVTVVDGYRSPNGIYQCYIATVPAEGDIAINPDTDNREENPDMTDTDHPEVAAWFDPATIPGMASLRPELEDTPWDQIAAAGTEPATPPPAEAAVGDTYAIPFPGEDTAAQEGAAPADDPAGEQDKDQGNGCVCPQEDEWVPCDCDQADAVTADANGEPAETDDQDAMEMAAMPADCKPCQAVAITASAGDPTVLTASATGWQPPAAFFTEPQMDSPQPITVDPATGQLSGLLAVWGTCHVGFRDRCVTPPRSNSRYGFFHTARIPTDSGALDVGLITMDTGHAALDLTASSTISHYDNTGTQAAVVRVGENEFGIWVAGVTLPFVTEEQRLRLSLASFSGDWRHIRGGAELVAALAVNTPGFPMPARRTGTDNTEYALVAAGALPAPRPPADTTDTAARADLDPDAVAAMVNQAMDAREARARRQANATAALNTFQANAIAARFGAASRAMASLSAALRADRATLARTKITGLDIEIPKGIRATPSDLTLASRKDFANWVEQQGGLPRKIKSVAKHLEAKGMGTSQAIATAVNVARKACASGDTNWPGKQTINAKSKAEYCAAIARWEQMKAAAKG